MINVTPKAVTKIRQLLEANGVAGGLPPEALAKGGLPAYAKASAGLRLGLVGGGCSGLTYKFKLEAEPRSNDHVFEYDGVKLFVDPKSYTYLKGLTLDYHESLMESGFVFENPNAQKSCSCGKSFLAERGRGNS